MATPTPLRDDSADSADSARTTTDDAAQDAASHQPGTTLSRYAAEIVHYEDAPDECTIYPTDVAEDDLVTTWISAQEGSYVSLAEMC